MITDGLRALYAWVAASREPRSTSKSRYDGGVVQHTRLREIWEALGDPYPQNVHPHLVRMMEFLDISFRLPSGTASLVAQLVPYVSPSLPWDHRSAAGVGLRVATCRFEFQGSIPGIIPYLIVRTHENSVGLHWRHGLFLRHRQTQSEALIELVESRTLRLTVRAPSPGYFFKELTATIDTTFKRYWPHLRWRAYVPCLGQGCAGEFEIRSLQVLRLQGLNDAPCVECGRLQDLGLLLVGADEAVPVAISSGKSDQRSQVSLSGYSSVTELAVRTSYALDRIRSALAAAREEVSDCPRLFMLIRDNKSRRRRFLFWRDHYKLELWCEHRGSEHPWEAASYQFSRPKKTVVKMAPYLTVVLKTLRLIVPAVGPVSGLTLTEADAKVIKDQMAIMKAIVDSVPEVATRENVVDSGDDLTPRHGAALRAFRSLLISLDSSTYYGGLEKVYTPSGAMLWVCPKHYPYYVEELPNLG